VKITYTPNPLNTVVELDEHEKRELWHTLRFNEMLDMLFSVHYEMTCKKEGPDFERIKREVDPDYYLNDDEGTPDKTKLDKRCDELLEHYLEELKGSHIGDCTCFAMSCSKCHAESMLGIDTIKGLGKHPGHKIQSAFSYREGDVWKERTIEEALEYLRNYDPKPTSDSGWDKVGGFEAHVPRWKSEAKIAYEWLLEYQATKLQPVDTVPEDT
jgi:hypothetical protein